MIILKHEHGTVEVYSDGIHDYTITEYPTYVHVFVYPETDASITCIHNQPLLKRKQSQVTQKRGIVYLTTTLPIHISGV